jgi:hypothetical protein
VFCLRLSSSSFNFAAVEAPSAWLDFTHGKKRHTKEQQDRTPNNEVSALKVKKVSLLSVKNSDYRVRNIEIKWK